MIYKIVKRLYSETDSARSIATSGAGVAGLVIYLMQRDWVIAAFSGVSVFSVARLLSARISERIHRAQKGGEQSEKIRRRSTTYSVSTISAVVQAFVQAGGSVLMWSHVHALDLRGPGT